MKSVGFSLGVNMARNLLAPSHPSSDALREYITKELQSGLVAVGEVIDIVMTQDIINGIHDAVRFLNSRMMRIPNVNELVATVQAKINPQSNEDDEDDPDEEEEEDEDDEDSDDSETESGSVTEAEEGAP